MFLHRLFQSLHQENWTSSLLTIALMISALGGGEGFKSTLKTLIFDIQWHKIIGKLYTLQSMVRPESLYIKNNVHPDELVLAVAIC